VGAPLNLWRVLGGVAPPPFRAEPPFTLPAASRVERTTTPASAVIMEFLTPIGQKVIKATAKEESATPGYLLLELANESMVDVKACEILYQCLMKRAAYNEATIKYKTFVVIKHLCIKGNPSLKRLFASGAQVIKDALQYKGVPHPLRGDAPNQLVRESAKAALAALYSQAKVVKTRKMEGFGGGGGFGSDGVGSNVYGNSGSGGNNNDDDGEGVPGRRPSADGDYEQRGGSMGGGGAGRGYGGGGGGGGTVLGPETSNKYGRGIGSSGSQALGKKRAEDHIIEGIQKAVAGIKTFGKEARLLSLRSCFRVCLFVVFVVVRTLRITTE
jgi:hypothetical protein